jgi:hypothetical protein
MTAAAALVDIVSVFRGKREREGERKRERES